MTCPPARPASCVAARGATAHHPSVPRAPWQHPPDQAVAVHEDLVFVGDEEGTFHAIERDSGKQKWKFETGAQIVSCASFYNGQVLFGSHDNSLYCLALADGSKAWQYATEGMVNCSPAISGDYTFITGCDSHLRVIDVRTGKQHTEMPLGTYLIASPTVIENMLYVGTHGGEVLAVDWKSQETVWTYKALQGEFPPFHSSTAVNDAFCRWRSEAVA